MQTLELPSIFSHSQATSAERRRGLFNTQMHFQNDLNQKSENFDEIGERILIQDPENEVDG